MIRLEVTGKKTTQLNFFKLRFLRPAVRPFVRPSVCVCMCVCTKTKTVTVVLEREMVNSYKTEW